MDEYIKRDAVLTTIWATSAEYDLFFPVLILNAIKAIPAADVRPVMTCIECKHSCDMPGGLRCCHGTCVDCYVEPEFFCAEGEKEESDTQERAGQAAAPTI